MLKISSRGYYTSFMYYGVYLNFSKKYLLATRLKLKPAIKRLYFKYNYGSLVFVRSPKHFGVGKNRIKSINTVGYIYITYNSIRTKFINIKILSFNSIQHLKPTLSYFYLKHCKVKIKSYVYFSV